MLSIRLKAARKALKLTQEELAKKVKTTKGTISNYENGHSTPSNDMLIDLSNALNTTTDYLLGRSNDTVDKDIDTSLAQQDSLQELNKLIKEFGIEQFGFFDIDKWKNLNQEDLDEIRRHFEWVSQKAKQRNEENHKTSRHTK